MDMLFVSGSICDLINQLDLCSKVLARAISRDMSGKRDELPQTSVDTVNSLVSRASHWYPEMFKHDTEPKDARHATCRDILRICVYASMLVLAEHKKYSIGTDGCTGYYIDAQVAPLYPDHTKIKFVRSHVDDTVHRINEWLRMHRQHTSKGV